MPNKEKYIWALDLSTTNVGCSLFNDHGKLVEMKHLKIDCPKTIDPSNREIYKANLFKEYCLLYKKHIEDDLDGIIHDVIIEEPLSNTSININTTAMLLAFNGMARYILYETLNIYPFKISVHESRRIFCPEICIKKIVKGIEKTTLSFPVEYKDNKKHYLWEKVAKLEPQIEWFYNKNNNLKTENYDLSDSFVCGFSGMIKYNLIDD